MLTVVRQSGNHLKQRTVTAGVPCYGDPAQTKRQTAMMGNMGNMMDMFGKVKEFQSRMKDAQDSLSSLTAEGESGAGLVKVTVSGAKQVIKLDIDPDLIRSGAAAADDREMLQDLIVAAINKALENVEPKIREHLKRATEGLLPNIPGLDLGGLM